MHSYFITTWGITNVLLLISFIFGVFKYPALRKDEKLYVFYIGFLLLIEASTNFLTTILGYKDTSFLYPIYIAGEFFLLTSLFIKKLNGSKYLWIVVFMLSVGFLIFNQIFSTYFNSDIVKVTSNIIIICFAGYTLLQQIKNGKSINRFTLVDACIFFYYSVSVFIFIIQHQIATLSEDDYYAILGTNNILSSILYGSFIYTFIKLKK
ncbi:hypothetical protein CEY12_10285 [Chryseobacterium sp. T16E-39]|uniref:hypothetical protein n=1 Tax=Chryseobacterium sp. T16E-39 TaxID=2015076 RepID=UPI000B5B29C7|nr:hypothetical protein [Chryseobacterium sp. T16E-39]ASK30472.1 hypothetical protein CEY12_10285 [Chryseobacterium sp. T16E-39]